jgi:predicted aspartyl protease
MDANAKGFWVSIEIGRDTFVSIDAWVDLDVTYAMIPADVLSRLGIEPTEDRPFVLPDGTETLLAVSWARLRIEGVLQPTIVVFGEPGSRVRLGMVTLSQFCFEVDWTNGRLIRVPARLRRVAAS